MDNKGFDDQDKVPDAKTKKQLEAELANNNNTRDAVAANCGPKATSGNQQNAAFTAYYIMRAGSGA